MSNNIVDMHLHSKWSDGKNTVWSLTNIVLEKKLRGAVLTDHDTVYGLGEFMSLCSRYGIETTTGIEISATVLGTGLSVDILGYGFNLGLFFENLVGVLEHNLRVRRQQFEKILRLYRIRGAMDFSLEQLTNKFHLPCLASNKYWLIAARAEILIKSHLIKKAGAIKKARKEIQKGGSFYEGREAYIDAAHVINCINRSGGISVWAHPAKTLEKLKEECGDKWKEYFVDMVKKMTNAGLGGLEVYTPYNEKDNFNFLLKYCRKYNLVVTGGSDYHGEFGLNDCCVGSEGIELSEFAKLFSHKE